MLITTCLFCWGCQGVPAWPESGVADADWVEKAIAWRLQTGLDACGETGKAVDALTLEWIAASPVIRVEITTNEWPVLRHYPELKIPLIQALAWGYLRGFEWENKALVKTLRQVIRKTNGLKNGRVRPYFKQTPTRML
ncbi:MAG: hypothetical protein CL845_04915 [Crocinitomicaceae bacterium]|nr:hypothetical protein [Crocinitomicaceae bacterium]